MITSVLIIYYFHHEYYLLKRIELDGLLIKIIR